LSQRNFVATILVEEFNLPGKLYSVRFHRGYESIEVGFGGFGGAKPRKYVYGYGCKNKSLHGLDLSRFLRLFRRLVSIVNIDESSGSLDCATESIPDVLGFY
jgi:hypothetical protein